MPSERVKSTAKGKLPLTGFSNFNVQRDKHHLTESDGEDLVPIEQASMGTIKRFKAKLKQVINLPTGDGFQETEGHPLGSVGEQEQIKTSNCKKVHFAYLPERYEPLIEYQDVSASELRADKRYKRKKQLKRCRKNIVKVLRAGWRYLSIGLQEFAKSYTTPFSTSFSVIAEVR